MPIPRSPLEGRFLSPEERARVCAIAKVTPANVRSWMRRYARINKDVERRIDAAVEVVVSERGEATMQSDDDDAPYVCPGCFAVNEPCYPGCIDAEIEEENRRREDDERMDDDGE